MQMAISQQALARADVDVVVMGVLHQQIKQATDHMDKSLGREVQAAATDHDFTGKAKQTLLVTTHGAWKAKRVALVGLGPADKLASETVLRAAGTAVRLGNNVGAKSVLLHLPHSLPIHAKLGELIGRGATLGAYRCDTYRSDTGRPATVKKFLWDVGAAQASRGDDSKATLARGVVLGEAVCLARDLVNAPALDLYPESFAARASKLAKDAGVRCQVLLPSALEKKGMNLLLAVGMGSARSPRLVHLTYAPPRSKGQPVVLVGKGITFDSGGLSLKPPDGMYGMKMDMGGAAAVLAAVLAAARLRLPHAVHGVMALAENMPSGTALRPGDVVTSMAGKTIEVNNTDAEGRLVLADALHYVQPLQPRCIIDLATLTGACMVALGPHTAGLFANDDAVADGLLAAAKAQGEDFWRMPLTPILREQLKSDIADMRNTGDRFGGAITAAMFLKEFVGEVPWAHLDIAGPATSSVDEGILTKGGTGVAVASLVEFVSALGGRA